MKRILNNLSPRNLTPPTYLNPNHQADENLTTSLYAFTPSLLTHDLYIQLADLLLKQDFETATHIAEVRDLTEIFYLTDTYQKTLLMFAVEGGNTALIRFLLSNAIDPDALASMKDFVGRTALITAGRSGHTESIKVILGSVHFPEQHIYEYDHFHCTALMTAAQVGNPESIKVLLSMASNPDTLAGMRDSSGRTALMYAAMAGNAESIKAILSGVKYPEELACMRDADGNTALILAASRNNAESIKALLSNVNNATQLAFMKNQDDYNALMLAAFDGSTETIHALLNHVKNPIELIYFSNDSGTTALMLCAQNENIDDLDSNVITVMLNIAMKIRDTNYRMSPQYKKGKHAYISLEPDSLIFQTDINGKNAFMISAEESNDLALLTLFNWTTDKLALLKQENKNQCPTVDLLDPDQCDALINLLEKQKLSECVHNADVVLSLLQKQQAHFL